MVSHNLPTLVKIGLTYLKTSITMVSPVVVQPEIMFEYFRIFLINFFSRGVMMSPYKISLLVPGLFVIIFQNVSKHSNWIFVMQTLHTYAL